MDGERRNRSHDDSIGNGSVRIRALAEPYNAYRFESSVSDLQSRSRFCTAETIEITDSPARERMKSFKED
jgi:hypothetical protein